MVGLYTLWNLRQTDGAIYGLGVHLKTLRLLLDHFDRVRVFTNIGRAPSAHDDALATDQVELVPLPGDGFVSLWKQLPRMRQILAGGLDGVDAMYVRLFDPLAWVVEAECRKRGIRLLFHVVGNPLEAIRQNPDWSLAGRWARRALFWPEEALTLRAARKHPVLINGTEMTRFFAVRGLPGQTIITSTLDESDFYLRPDPDRPVRTILFVGFVRPAKRVDVLIEAFAALKDPQIRLRIVGGADPDLMGRLTAGAAQRGVADRVDFVGHVPLGPALMQEYREADLFAFASATEGSPRSLLEAAANSLPCVTSDVGSARDLFESGRSGMIVPVGDAPALAAALQRLVAEPALRRACSEGALASARRFTAATFVGRLAQELKSQDQEAVST